MDNEPIQKGRRIFTPEQRAEFVRRFRESGLKQHEFVIQEGVSLASLSNWLRRERGRPRVRMQKPEFAEVTLPQKVFGGAWQLEIVSPKNWTLRLAQNTSGEQLRSMLESLPC